MPIDSNNKASSKLIETILYTGVFSILYISPGLEGVNYRIFSWIRLLQFPICAMLVIVSLVLLKNRNLPKENHYKIVWVVFFFYFYLLIVSFLRGTSWNTVLSDATIVISTLLLLAVYGSQMFRVLSPLLLAFEWQIYLNLFTLFLFPNGMYEELLSLNSANWYLGYDNGWNYTFFPALLISIIVMCISGNKVRFIILLVVMEFQTFYRWSVMCSIGFIIFDILLLFRIYRIKLLNIRKYFVLALVVIITLVFFREKLPFLRELSRITGKDLMTMSNRQAIWNRALQLIKLHPVFGYGRISYKDLVSHYYYIKDASHAHNMILELLFRGGLVLLLIYILYLVTVIKTVLVNRNTDVISILSACYFCIFLMMITQVYLTPPCMTALAIGAFSEKFAPICNSLDKTKIGKRKIKFCNIR